MIKSILDEINNIFLSLVGCSDGGSAPAASDFDTVPNSANPGTSAAPVVVSAAQEVEEVVLTTAQGVGDLINAVIDDDSLSLGSGVGGGGGGSTSVELGLWVEFNKKNLGAILKNQIINAKAADPKIKINRLVLRLQAGPRSRAGAGETSVSYRKFIAINNGNFYNWSSQSVLSGSFIELMKSLPDSINEIWILPYQAADSGFDSNPNGVTGSNLYFKDLYKAAQFITAWKRAVSIQDSNIADKIKGIVCETEGTTMRNAAKIDSFKKLNTRLGFPGFTKLSLHWGLTGPPSIGNNSTDYSNFTRFFPQYYNIDFGSQGVIANNQDETNKNFTTSTLTQSYTLESNYTRMFSVEDFNAPQGKWGNDRWGPNARSLLSKMIKYITSKYTPPGGYMLYCDADFWASAPSSILK